MAAGAGDDEVVARGLALDRGADVATRSVYGLTPKQLAAANSHEDIVKLLTEAGATEELEGEVQEAEEQVSAAPGAEGEAKGIGDWEELSEAETQLMLGDAQGVLKPYELSDRIRLRIARLQRPLVDA